MVNRDSRAEMARLQKEIQNALRVSAEDLVYEYQANGNNIRLDLITVNPRHNQSFLFHSTVGVDKLDALEKMVEYVKSNRSEESTYTVQWMTKGDKELQTSYFRAKNIYEVLDKLYYGRDMNNITVYTVKLNPMS